jgi:hypothetical protein
VIGLSNQKRVFIVHLKLTKQKMDTIFKIGYQAAKDAYEKQKHKI